MITIYHLGEEGGGKSSQDYVTMKFPTPPGRLSNDLMTPPPFIGIKFLCSFLSTLLWTTDSPSVPPPYKPPSLPAER